jgi:hypothetical protein
VDPKIEDQADLLKKIEDVWCRRGDTSSFILEIIKIAREFAKSADSLRFLSLIKFLFSLSYSHYSLWCSLVIDTKQTPKLWLIWNGIHEWALLFM